MVEQPAFGYPGPLGNGIQRGGPLPHLDEEGFESIQDGVPGNWFSGMVSIMPKGSPGCICNCTVQTVQLMT